jgi:hypothetical protein
VLERSLAGSEHDRDDVQGELVEQPGREVLAHGARAAGDRDVQVAGRGLSPLERGLDPVGDELERRAAVHRQRLARMVGQHEDRSVVGRVLAPPAGPRLVPRAVAAAEHPAAHDVGADVLGGVGDDLRVDVVLAAFRSVLSPAAVCLKHPLVQAHAAFADRVVDALVGSGAEAVER